MRFGELAKAVPGLSDRLLSQRLRELEDAGVVERSVEPGTPVRVTYSLTEKGADLRPGDLPSFALGRAAGRARARRAVGQRAAGPVRRSAATPASCRRRCGSRARVQLVGEVTGMGAAGSRPTSSCATPRAPSPARSGSTTWTAA